jgi:hypothetical protein
MDLPFGWVISNLRIAFSRGEKNANKEFSSGKDHTLPVSFFNGIGYL